jgi:putative DNA primase/helicase
MKRDNVWDWLAEQEGPGILRWLVQGASDYLTNGMMPTPSSIEDATKSYRLREDWLGQFLIENIVECPGHTVTKDALYRVYSHWCENGGLKPLGKIKLGTALVERKGWSMECRDTSGNRAWDEIALVNPDLLIDLS